MASARDVAADLVHPRGDRVAGGQLAARDVDGRHRTPRVLRAARHPPERRGCRAPRSRTSQRSRPSPSSGAGAAAACRGDATATMSQRNQSAPASARFGLGREPDGPHHAQPQLARRTSEVPGEPGGAGAAHLPLRGLRVHPPGEAGLRREVEPADEVGLRPCAVVRHATGAVRPTTATAWRNDRAWHSPTSGVGPGSGGAISVGVEVEDGDGVGSSAGASVGEVQPDSRTAAASGREEPPHPITRAASVPPSSYADSRSASPTSPSTSRTGALWRQAERTDDRLHRAHGARRVVAPVDVEAERLAAALDRRGRAVVGEGAAGLEEDRVEEVLERAAHVAEVRRRAEHVAVRGEHVVGVGLERRADDHLDARDRVVRGAGDDGLGQRGHRRASASGGRSAGAARSRGYSRRASGVPSARELRGGG